MEKIVDKIVGLIKDSNFDLKKKELDSFLFRKGIWFEKTKKKLFNQVYEKIFIDLISGSSIIQSETIDKDIREKLDKIIKNLELDKEQILNREEELLISFLIDDWFFIDPTKEKRDKLERIFDLFNEEKVKGKYKESAQNYLKEALENILKKHYYSPEDEKELEKKASILGAKLVIEAETQQLLEKLRKRYNIYSGKLETIFVPINLQKGELCYWEGYVGYNLIKSKAKRINYAGPRVRVKIMKGLYYTAGSCDYETIRETVVDYQDGGDLYLTNKRIIFSGTTKNLSIKWDKIINYESLKDGIIIHKDSGSPIVFEFEDPYGFFIGIFEHLLEDREVIDSTLLEDIIEEEKNILEEKNEFDYGQIDNSLLKKAIEAIIKEDNCSATLLQRKLNIGFAKAAMIIDALEEKGFIGVSDGTKPRNICIDKMKEYLKNI